MRDPDKPYRPRPEWLTPLELVCLAGGLLLILAGALAGLGLIPWPV